VVNLQCMKNYYLLLTLFIFIFSCATPTIVNVIGPNDNNLNCEELSEEIARVNKIADEAKEDSKMNKPHNVGAILFFLPGYGVTMKNIDEALLAAKERTLHLNKLKERKGC